MSTWLFYFSIVFKGFILILGRTRKFLPPPWHKGGGGGWMESLSWVFDMLQYFETILPLVESLWSSQQDCRYISWVVALLEACDVTNNGLHLGCHLGFYQELEIRLKPREIVIFVMAWFYFWKKLKKHVFSPKIGLTNCTFNVISRNHSTWP